MASTSTRSCPCQTAQLCWIAGPGPAAEPPARAGHPDDAAAAVARGGTVARAVRRMSAGVRRGVAGAADGAAAATGRPAGRGAGPRGGAAPAGRRRGAAADRARGRARVAVRPVGGRRRRDHVRLRPLGGHRRGPGAAAGAPPVEGFSDPAWLALLALGHRLGLFDHGTWFGVPDYVAYPKTLAIAPARGGVRRVPRRGVGGVAVPGRRHRRRGLRLRADPVVRDLERVRAGERAARRGRRGAGGGARAAPRPARRAVAARARLRPARRAGGAHPARGRGLRGDLPARAAGRRPPRWRELGAAALSVVAFAVPFGAYLAWRLATFGQWLPTTAIAKSQGLPTVAGFAKVGSLIAYAGWPSCSSGRSWSAPRSPGPRAAPPPLPPPAPPPRPPPARVRHCRDRARRRRRTTGAPARAPPPQRPAAPPPRPPPTSPHRRPAARTVGRRGPRRHRRPASARPSPSSSSRWPWRSWRSACSSPTGWSSSASPPRSGRSAPFVIVLAGAEVLAGLRWRGRVIVGAVDRGGGRAVGGGLRPRRPDVPRRPHRADVPDRHEHRPRVQRLHGRPRPAHPPPSSPPRSAAPRSPAARCSSTAAASPSRRSPASGRRRTRPGSATTSSTSSNPPSSAPTAQFRPFIGLDADPRFQRDYVEIGTFTNGGANWVRRDLVPDAATLARLQGLGRHRAGRRRRPARHPPRELRRPPPRRPRPDPPDARPAARPRRYPRPL